MPQITNSEKRIVALIAGAIVLLIIALLARQAQWASTLFPAFQKLIAAIIAGILICLTVLLLLCLYSAVYLSSTISQAKEKHKQ